MIHKYYFYSLTIFILFSSISFAQISPGDLTEAHAKLEGMSNCTECHVLGEQVYNSKCLDCHEEIQETMDENRGYHSSNEVSGKNCWSCHSEHHGRNFRIVNFDPDNFNHNITSFKLEGKHAEIKCRECHNSKYISDPDLIIRKDTYLGLSTKCKSCHEDYHQGTLKEEGDCLTCHNVKSFRPAPKFNHNNSAYKLTGKHINVECINCHPKEQRNGKEFQKFSGLNFSNCGSCHKDVHQGKFGQNCKNCHSTDSFKNINERNFNHNKTDFPLGGKHKIVKCNECHKTEVTKPLPHEKCLDCHKDYHNGQFTKNSLITDCSKCHNEKGFTPSLFTIDDHNKTNFKLTGSHLAVPCRNCHFNEDPAKAKWSFKNLGEDCIDCHKNVHDNEITIDFMPNDDCTKCHETSSWYTISFDHKKTNFELIGKHNKVSCGECHHREIDNEKIYKFKSLKSSCEFCHKDVHFGQFIEDSTSTCNRCHGFDNWEPVKFDHNNTNFSLKGAHEKVKCSECHKKVEQNGNKFIKYKLEDFKCAACHSS